MPTALEVLQAQQQEQLNKQEQSVDEFTQPATPQNKAATPALDALTPQAPDTPPDNPGSVFTGAQPETWLGELGAGVNVGLRQIQSTYPSLAAMVQQNLGNQAEAERLARQGVEVSQRGSQPTVSSIADIEGLGDFARFTAGVTGQSIPFILSIMLGGGAAAGGSRIVAGMARAGLPAATRRAVASRIPQVSSNLIGGFGTAAAIETAATSQELYQATNEIHTPASVLAGTAKGALESILPFMLTSRIKGLNYGEAKGWTSKFIERLARIGDESRIARAGAGAATEAATESTQELVDVVTRDFIDENYDPSRNEVFLRLANAASAGGIAGSIFNGILPGRRFSTEEGGAVSSESIESAVLSSGVVPRDLLAELDPSEVPEVDPTDVSFVDKRTGGINSSLGVDRALHETLSSFDNRTQDLYGVPVENGDVVFTSPVQARENALLMNTEEVRRIDPDKATREDVVSGAFDLPTTIHDKRITLPSANNPGARQGIEALKLAIGRAKAARSAPDGATQRRLLTQAQQAYRTALDNGVRVEPLRDGSVQITNPARLDEITERVDLPQSTLSKARVSGAFRRKSTGETYTLFNRQSEDERGLDTFQVNSDEVTATPDSKLIRFIRSDNRLRRSSPFSEKSKLDLARTQGIRAPNVEVLNEFINIARSFNPSKSFQNQQEDQKVAFLKLLDKGLRIDYTTDSQEFMLLRKPNKGDLRKHRRQVSPPKTAKVGRRRKATAIKSVGESTKGLTAFVRTAFNIRGGKNRVPTVLTRLINGDLQNLIRNQLNSLGVRAQVQIKFSKPNEFSDKYGVVYKEEGLRSSIYVDLWKYSEDNILTSNYMKENAGRFGASTFKQTISEENMVRLVNDILAASGQITIAKTWETLPHGVKRELMRAYSDQQALSRLEDARAFVIRNFAHPAVRHVLGRVNEYGVADTNIVQDWFFSFEEWFGQQVAKYMTTDIEALSLGAQSLKRSNTNILRMMKKVRKEYDLGDTDPNEVASALVESLRARASMSATQPMTNLATLDSAAESELEQIEKLNKIGLTNTRAQPESEATQNIRKLLARIEPDNAETKTILEGLTAQADSINGFKKWWSTLPQLAQDNPHIPGLQRYVDRMRSMQADVMKWISTADTRVRQIRALGKQRADKLINFMFELDSMTYLTKEQRETSPRWPNREELQALVDKYDLDQPTFDTYLDMRDDFLGFLNEMEEVWISQAEKALVDSPEALAKRKSEIEASTSSMRSRPYFPHMRFGDFFLYVKNKKGKVVYFEAFQDKGDRDRAKVEAQKQFPGLRVQEDVASEIVKPYQGLPPYAINEVMRALGLVDAEGNVNPDTLTSDERKQVQQLQLLTIQSSPLSSFKRRFTPRENVPGHSLDGMQAYARYFQSGSKFIARQKHRDLLQEEVNSVRNSRRELDSADKRTKIADFMQDHLDAELNPQDDWAQIRSLAFTFYLGFVPKAALINLTQLPLVTWPYITHHFGNFKGSAEMTKTVAKAIKDYFNKYRTGEEQLGDTELQAMEQAVEEAIVDEGQAVELAAIGEAPNLERMEPGNNATRFIKNMGYWSSFMFSGAEKINRRITFLTVFRLAMENNNAEHIDKLVETNTLHYNRLVADRGWTPQVARAYLAAADSVRKTQFEYQRWARPRFMRGKKGVIFTFFMFVQNMLHFVFKSPRGQAGKYLLLMLFAGGIMGLPGGDDLNRIIKSFAKQLGYRIDFEKEIRELYNAFAGTDSTIPPDIILRGTSRVGFGLGHAMEFAGLPGPDFDLSYSIGMGSLTPGLQGLDRAQGSDKFSQVVGELTRDIAGPSLGIAFNLLEALSMSELPLGDPKRWERAMPTALRSVSKSLRYGFDLRERDRGGATVKQFDFNDPSDYAEALGVALGFQPTDVSRAWDARMAQRDAIAYWQGRRAILLDQYDRAKQYKDKEAFRDVLNAIKRFNPEAPPGMKISSKTLSRSFKGRQKRRILRERMLGQTRSERAIALDVLSQYPEVESKIVTLPNR